MIVLDSSAVVTIMLNEPGAGKVAARLSEAPPGQRLISTANYVEAGAVVAGRIAGNPRQGLRDLDAFLSRFGVDLAPFDDVQARLALEARITFGRGFGGRGKLNLGDCFAYALAKSLGAPLLFTGNDFSKTDITSAL